MADETVNIASAVDDIVRSAKSTDEALTEAIKLAQSLPAESFGGVTQGGVFTPYDMSQRINAILSQMAVSATQRSVNSISPDSIPFQLSGMLGRPWMESSYKLQNTLTSSIYDNPELWRYSPDMVGKSQMQGDTTQWIIDPRRGSLTPEELKKIQATNEGNVNLINAATGQVMQFDPIDGRIFTLDTQPNTFRYNNQLIGETYQQPGKSWGYNQGGGLMFGTFTKNADGSFTSDDKRLNEAGVGTLSGSGFTNLMAKFGVNVNNIKPGESITIGENGIQYGGQTFAPPSGFTPQGGGTGGASMPYYGGGSNSNMPYYGSSSGTQNMVNPYTPGSDQANAWQERKSAYDILYSEFNKYGLGGLVQPLQQLIMSNISPSEFAIQLQNTDAYKKRFAANQDRIAKGLRALTPAEYISLEDQYQNVMRNYGLPASYYAKDSLGTQAGFNQFISNDVSASELEDRILTAQKRVQYANPEVSIALKTFYPDITDGDILAYVLDPKNGLENIKRRITAAEIGGSAVAMGLTSNETDAEYLARYGVNKQMAQQGYQTIAGLLPRASQLSDIYAQQGANPYTQATAEREVFGVPGAADAARQRKKLVDLETAAFSGSAGSSGGALARERAGGF